MSSALEGGSLQLDHQGRPSTFLSGALPGCLQSSCVLRRSPPSSLCAWSLMSLPSSQGTAGVGRGHQPQVERPPPPVTFVHPFVHSFIFFTQHSFYSSVDIKGDEYLALPVKSPASWAPILRMCWKGKNSRTGKVGSFKVIGAKDGE